MVQKANTLGDLGRNSPNVLLPIQGVVNLNAKMFGINAMVPWQDDRKQFCRVDDTSSDVKRINCGVP